MGLFSRRKEQRAEAVQFEDGLLKALLGEETVTKEMALAVPAVAGGIDLIAGVVAGTPVKLYRDENGKAVEVRDDPRLRLLNDETGDTLNANEFWRAMVRDYYTGKGGYAFINRRQGKILSLHYVDEACISILRNNDPIFKDFDICVDGASYKPFQFLKILRATKDGMEGTPITQESAKLIEVAYQTLCFELYLVRKGGNKKGFLKSAKKLDQQSMDALRESFRKLYGNGTNSDNVVVLNDGIDFKESSASSVEMQLNENKITNADEFSKLFHISPDVMSGKPESVEGLAKMAAIPLMTTIQCALNRDFLLESEKGTYYWAFDTKELLKGSRKERYEAYRMALDANFMGIDEVRYEEDLPPLGLTWIKLGLNDVLYDPKTKLIYTPNTNQTSQMGEKPLQTAPGGGTMDEPDEQRAGNPYHDARGRFTSGPSSGMRGGGSSSSGKKTKYAPSKRRNPGGITLKSKAEYAMLCGTFYTRYPNAKAGEVQQIWNAKYEYVVEADGNGSLIIHSRKKL